MPPSRMNSNALLRAVIQRLNSPRIPQRISRNFRPLDAAGAEGITAALRRHYFTRPIWGETVTPEAYLSSEEGRRDLQDHVEGRLDNFRRLIIPWLDSARSLSGANVLEIGCGTGSSTVALAEQGAAVTAVDVDADSLRVAKDRCRTYGLDVEFLEANATEVHRLLCGRHFDFIVFFACLEHMTHDERIGAMKSTWDMLARNDLWCVIETPNRLWYFDSHTAWLPFYMWLPDDLAFAYSEFSPRQPFCRTYQEPTGDAMLSFLRKGRGVSYHEFEIAIKKAEDLAVVSSLSMYLKKHTPFWSLGKRLLRTPNYRFESFLNEVGPKVDRGFYQPSLDLIIRRD